MAISLMKETRDLSFVAVVNKSPLRLTQRQIQFFNKSGYVKPLDAFTPAALDAYVRYGFAEGMLPVSEDCSARTMALPFHARLDRADQERVADALRTAVV